MRKPMSVNNKFIKSGFIRLAEIKRIYNTPRLPLIHGLANQGETILLSGKPGVGKTVFALKLADALASGTPFLGRDTTQQQVGIIQAGQSIKTTIEYVKRYVKDRKNIFIFQPDDKIFDLRLPTHQKQVLDAAVEKGLKTIILDYWRAAIGDSNENALTSVYPLYCLKKKLEPYNTSLIIIHHTNKMGKPRGSKALEWLANVCLTLSTYPEPEKQNVRKLKCYKNWFNEIGEWDLTFDSKTGEYSTAPISSDLVRTDKQKIAQALLDWFESKAPESVEAKEVIKALSISKSSAYAHLKVLTEQGLLLKKGRQWCLPNSPLASSLDRTN